MLKPKLFLGGLALLTVAFVPFAGCGGDDSGGPNGSSGDASIPPWGDGGGIGPIAMCSGDAASPADTPSGYLHITKNRLAKLQADAMANTPPVAALKANVEKYLTNLDPSKSGPENAALAYLLTNDARYAATALAWAQKNMAIGIAGENKDYLEFGELMKSAALVLNYTKPALTMAQAAMFADYLDASCNELWFHPVGAQWGLSDSTFSFAGNNYRMAFLQGTAYAGYALQALGDARGMQWINLLTDKLERKGGVFDYIDQYQSGGDWLEGANYGERSKQRLFHALSITASMGGKNYFNQNPFFANSIVYGIYQAEPDNGSMYPSGDLARSADNSVSPYDREYMQLSTYWLCDSPAQKLGQYYLTNVAKTYLDGSHSFDYDSGLYLDVLFGLSIDSIAASTLPLSYRAAGTNWVNARSGWDTDATSVSISGAPIFDQSHQHMDMGSFLIWKNGWQAADPETFHGNGPYWTPESEQGLFVPNRELRFDGPSVPGLVHYADKGAAVYVQVDLSNLYRKRNVTADTIEMLLNEHTREIVYLRPNTVFVFDRVDAKPGQEAHSLRFHFPKPPALSGSRYSVAYQGGGISLVPLLGGAVTMASDMDLGSGGSRIEQAATGGGAVSRFLSVVEVASGSAPQTTATLVGAAGGMRGALSNGAVVLFSDLPRGATPSLPITYSVPGTAMITHVLLNMSGSYAVSASRSGGNTNVTISAGTDATADADGVLVIMP